MSPGEFITWHRYHRILHQHRDWTDPESAEGLVHYEGWLEALGSMGASEEEARAASRRLQKNPPGFPDKHLGAVVDSIREARRDRAIVGPAKASTPVFGLDEAKAKSRGCPECEGKGMARRRALVYAIPRPITLNFYCRCAAGRTLLAARPERDREFDDLQAHPELWDHDLAYRGWSIVPSRRYLPPDAQIRYLAPGEEAPAPPVLPPDRERRKRTFDELPSYWRDESKKTVTYGSDGIRREPGPDGRIDSQVA